MQKCTEVYRSVQTCTAAEMTSDIKTVGFLRKYFSLEKEGNIETEYLGCQNTDWDNGNTDDTSKFAVGRSI